MNSLEIFEIKNTINQYLQEQKIPAEVKRMILAEILQNMANESQNELLAELKAREEKKGEQ